VVDGKTGFIVPDGDTKAIADRLLKVSKDTALRTRMGEEGKKYAKEHDWSLVVRRFVDLYLSITSKRVIDN
jgi:glycosyltransferase involved in cell wall biosynthesis